MDFVDALRVLGRRWLVVLLGVLVTGGAGFYAITVVPTQYQARAQYVLLLPSGATGVNNPTNPYINLNSGLIFVTSLIASDLGTKDVARSLVKGGFESDYSIAQSTSGGPSLDVVVNGDDADDVLATRNELLGRFDEELDSLQDVIGIPDRQLIFSRTNAVDPVAEVVPGAKKKALVLIAAVGMIVTLIMAFSLDGVLRRRTARKLALKETAAGEPEPPEDGPTDAETPANEPAETRPTQAEPAKAEQVQAEPEQAEPEQAEPTPAEPTDAEPTKIEPTDAEPTPAEPTDAEPTTVEPADAEPEPDSSAPAETTSPEVPKSEPEEAKNGTTRTEPGRTVPTLSGRKLRRSKSVSRTS